MVPFSASISCENQENVNEVEGDAVSLQKIYGK